jgi:hypothetical protein
LLTDVTVHRDGDTITAHVRFAAGEHTTLSIPATKPSCEQRRTPPEVIAIINERLDQHTSDEIAEILNRRGITSGTGEAFHRRLVDDIIRAYRLPTRRQRLRATGLLTQAEIASRRSTSAHTPSRSGDAPESSVPIAITTKASSSTNRPTTTAHQTARRSADPPGNERRNHHARDAPRSAV